MNKKIIIAIILIAIGLAGLMLIGYSPDEEGNIIGMNRTEGEGFEKYALWSDNETDIYTQLQAHYKFNNDTHTAIDSTGQNNGTYNGYTFNDGELNGTTLTSDGKYGNAYEFDGSDDYVDLGDTLNLTNKITINAWVKPRSIGTARAIAGKMQSLNTPSSGGYMLWKKSNNKVALEIEDGTDYWLLTGTELEQDTWHHVVGVIDTNNESNTKIYVDGEDVSGSPAGDSFSSIDDISTPWPFRVGNRGDGNSPFNGSIDEVRIWDKALSQSQIQAEMNSSSPVEGQGLISSYSFEKHNATHTFDTNNLINGKIFEGGNFDGVDDYVDLGDTSLDNQTFTYSAWLKTDLSGDNSFLVRTDQSSFKEKYNKINFQIHTSGGWVDFFSNTSLNANEWTHIVLTYDNRDGKIYINGNEDASHTFNGDITTGSGDTHIGGGIYGGREFNGSIDDVRIYNRSLSGDEIKVLYNNGAGTEDISTGYIGLNSPADGSIDYDGSVTFNATASMTGDDTLVNMSLWTNESGGWEIVNSTDVTGSENTTLFNRGYDGGEVFSWNYKVCDTNNKCGFSNSNYTLSIDVAPNVALNSPADNYQTSVDDEITFNCTATDDVSLANVSLYIDGSINETNSSGVNGDYIFTKNLSIGNHNWTCEGTDSESQTTKPAARNLTVYDIELNAPPNDAVINDSYVLLNASVWGSDSMNVSFYNSSLDYVFNDATTYYKLDETTGDVVDTTGNGNNGTNYGATRGVNGKINNSFDFDGNKDWIEPYDFLSSDDESFSWNLWFNLDNVTTRQELISSTNPSIEIEVYEGDLYLYTREGTGDRRISAGSLQTGIWYMTTLTYNHTSDEFNLYLNAAGSNYSAGVIDDQGGYSDAIGGAQRHVAEGIDLSTDGKIDEVVIWNRTLNSTGVSRLYNNGIGLSYLKLDTSTNIASGNSATYNWTGLKGNSTYEWFSKLEEGSYSLKSEIGTFTTDPVTPEINVTAPTDIIDLLGYVGKNQSINITVSDNNDNLDTCWYNYNGTNITLDCSNNITLSLESYGFNHNIQVWANDTLGNIGTDTHSWDYLVFENSQSYGSSVSEGERVSFSINISYNGEDYVPSGYLVYNGTEYPAETGDGGNITILSRNITVPDVDSNTDFDFHWYMGMTNASGTTYINSSSNSQTVTTINMSETGSPYTPAFINFIAYDEETDEELNATFSATFTYMPEGGEASNTYSYTDMTENNSQWSFSFDPSNQNYSIDASLELDADGYVHKFYNFKDLTVYNTTREMRLYLLPEASSTSFIVSVRDSSYTPVSGVEVYVQRYYPSTNEWKTVEVTETDENGKTVQHFYTEDVEYRFKVYDEGLLLYTTEKTQIYCESSPCTVEIIIPEEFDYILDEYIPLNNLDSTLEYDEDEEEVTFTYSDTSGNFTSGRLYVVRTHFGNATEIEVCNKTNGNPTAVINCDMSSAPNATYIAIGYVTRNKENMVKRITFKKIEDIVDKVGEDGVLWAIFLMIGIMMLGVYRPSLGIIFGSTGLIMLSLLNIISIPITALVAAVGIAVILLIGVNKQ